MSIEQTSIFMYMYTSIIIMLIVWSLAHCAIQVDNQSLSSRKREQNCKLFIIIILWMQIKWFVGWTLRCAPSFIAQTRVFPFFSYAIMIFGLLSDLNHSSGIWSAWHAYLRAVCNGRLHWQAFYWQGSIVFHRMFAEW